MSVRAASSWFTQAIFGAAVFLIYLGIAAGLLGYIDAAAVALVALAGCAIGCLAGMAYFLISQQEFRRVMNTKLEQPLLRHGHSRR
jgi:hypothetical protein